MIGQDLDSKNGKGKMDDLDQGIPACSENRAADTISFSADDLIELETYRDEEIDALVDAGLLPKKDRWNPDLRNCLRFRFLEIVLVVVTGQKYPVQCLHHHIENISLPKEVVDSLRVILRKIVELDSTAENWKT